MTYSLLIILFTIYEKHPWDKSKSEWLCLITTMWWVAGTVERQAAHFYRITVTESDLKSGLIITCKSTGKDKFKLVFFDQEVSSDTWHVMMPRADTCVWAGARDHGAGESAEQAVLRRGPVRGSLREVQPDGVHAAFHDEASRGWRASSLHDSRHIWQGYKGP